MKRICWPWCYHRRRARAIRRDLHSLAFVESRGGWLPASEQNRRDELTAELEELTR